MVYRPPVKTSEFDGPSGAAKVALNGNKTKAKVTFNDSGDSYVVDVKNCSDEVKGYIRSGEFIVKMSKDKDKLYSMSPVNGLFEGKVIKFSSKKDQPPAPMTKISKNKEGQTYSYLFFVVTIEIVSGEYSGMHVPLFLRYNFEECNEEIKGEVRKVTRYDKQIDKSKHTAFLDEFMSVTGAWSFGPIPYSDNVLPTLEKRILRKEKVFNFLMKKGYVDNFYEKVQEPEPTDDFSAGASFDGEDLTDDPTEETATDKFE